MKLYWQVIPLMGPFISLTSLSLMINLSQQDLATVRNLTDRTYLHLHPDVRTYLNQQLLEAGSYWEFQEWLSRMELTARWYEDPASRPVRRVRRTKTEAN